MLGERDSVTIAGGPEGFYSEVSRRFWPSDEDDEIFIGRFISMVGNALFPKDWRDEDLLLVLPIYLGPEVHWEEAEFELKPFDPVNGITRHEIHMRERVNFYLGRPYKTPVTETDWEAAEQVATEKQAAWRAAADRWHAVQDHIAEAAKKGKIDTLAAPIRGGGSEKIDPTLWRTSSSAYLIHRFLEGRIDLELPFGNRASQYEGSHYIFIETAGANAWLSEISGASDSVQTDGKLPISASIVPASMAKARTECSDWLRGQFADPASSGRTKADFRADAQCKWGIRLSGRGFEKAWQTAANDFPDRKKSGPKAIKSRL